MELNRVSAERPARKTGQSVEEQPGSSVEYLPRPPVPTGHEGSAELSQQRVLPSPVSFMVRALRVYGPCASYSETYCNHHKPFFLRHTKSVVSFVGSAGRTAADIETWYSVFLFHAFSLNEEGK